MRAVSTKGEWEGASPNELNHEKLSLKEKCVTGKNAFHFHVLEWVLTSSMTDVQQGIICTYCKLNHSNSYAKINISKEKNNHMFKNWSNSVNFSGSQTHS